MSGLKYIIHITPNFTFSLEIFCSLRINGYDIRNFCEFLQTRIKIDKNGRPFMNGLHDSIRNIAESMTRTNEPLSDWPWNELTPVLMEPGDVVISLHSLPHTPTPNLGPNPRMNVYFRIRKLRPENPHEGTRRIAHGVSDHPDRGYFGQYLDYPEDYDPWKTSIDLLCDHWQEWPGMRDIVPS